MNISYRSFFVDRNFHKIYLLGICADVCVKGAAPYLRDIVPSKIIVIEAATFYLNACARPALEKIYREKGIGILKVKGNTASNGDNPGDISSLLAFYLRHPKACVAVLEAIAITAVVIAALACSVSMPVVAAIAGVAVVLASVGVFYTRPAAEHETLDPEHAMYFRDLGL